MLTEAGTFYFVSVSYFVEIKEISNLDTNVSYNFFVVYNIFEEG